jgi:50S ribosomal subunit-associated GTPase HflX
VDQVDRGAAGRVTRVFVSALNGDGLDALRRLIADEVARAADLNSQDTVTILPDGSAVEFDDSAPADPA